MSLAGAAQGIIGTAVVALLLYAAFRLFLWQMGKVMALQHKVTVSRQSAVQPAVDQPPG
jgi:hypothetical protein